MTLPLYQGQHVNNNSIGSTGFLTIRQPVSYIPYCPRCNSENTTEGSFFRVCNDCGLDELSNDWKNFFPIHGQKFPVITIANTSYHIEGNYGDQPGIWSEQVVASSINVSFDNGETWESVGLTEF